MISINSKKYENSLVAMPTKHGLENYKNYSKNFDVFQTSLNEYVMLFEEGYTTNDLYRAFVSFFETNKKPFNIDVDSFVKMINNENEQKTFIEVLAIAIEMATNYSWNVKTTPDKLADVNLLISNKDLVTIYEERAVVAQAQTHARRLQDMPSNLLVPGTFCEEVKKIFKDIKNVKINVIKRKDLEAKGLKLLVGVGQASHKEITDPCLLTIEYYNDTANKEDITAFVGKGVCFDTGGLNIKTANHMRWMKYDMSGAAIVAMTLYSLAKNNIQGNYVAVCPLVINLCDTEGQRPDDVVTSYLGKTVEIDNTDAEGRLILADALVYAWKDLKAKRIFDIATLTGAMIYGLGDTYTGVWTTKDCMWDRIKVAADQAGELVWRMPFHKDFLDMLKSSVADIANSVSDPRGGSSRAACFLKEFTNDLPYAHFDVAATATTKNLGTGIMLNTFYNYAKNKKCA